MLGMQVVQNCPRWVGIIRSGNNNAWNNNVMLGGNYEGIMPIVMPVPSK